MTTLTTGQQLPELVLNLDRDTARQYAQVSGDNNPIHLSDEAARKLGLDGVIIHGMWTMGAAIRVVTEFVGPDWLLDEYSARFIKPISCAEPTQVHVSASVTDATEASATIAIEATCDSVAVLKAKAKISHV